MGRDTEISDVARRLRQAGTRLVTIVGRSGVGKTRLAIELAQREGGGWPGHAVFVDLTRTDDVALIPDLVAGALGTQAAPGQQAEDAIRARLRYAATLLVVDEIDRAPGAVDLLLDLISESPDSRVLATAHRPLRHPEESVVRLAPLPVPGADVTVSDELATIGSIVLYAERAAAVDPTFDLRQSDLAAVAELCRRLDGLPLAIELGATRARIMPPAAQVAALDVHSSLDLRSPRGVDRPTRHRDVRSAVAVSHDFAGERERIVLRRMSVFAAGCTSSMLQAVVGEPGWTLADILDALVELVDLALVEVDPGDDDEPRYRLLPTVAAFARERLDASGELDATERRHDAAFVAVAARAAGLAEQPQLRVLERDAAELHAVFAKAAAQSRVRDALELATYLAPLWQRRGLFAGPRTLFEQVLDQAGPDLEPEILSRALLWWVRLSNDRPAPSRDRELIVQRLARGVELARASGDPALLLFALETVVHSVFVTGDFPGAAQATVEGAALSTAVGDEAAQIRFEYRLGMVAGQTGRVADAIRLGSSAYERAARARDVRSMVRSAMLLTGLPPETPGLPDPMPSLEALLDAASASGELAEQAMLYPRLARDSYRSGNLAVAAAWTLRGLTFANRFGAWHSSAYCLANLVFIASDRGDDEAAARLHGSLTPVMTEVMVGLTAGPGGIYRAAVETARERLGAATFDRLVAEGSLLRPDEAIALGIAYTRELAEDAPVIPLAAHESRPPSRPEPSRTALTPRELDILRELATGATNRQIGDKLGLRPKTVMHHSVSIYSKLGLRGRTEAAAWAYREGMLD